MVDCRLILCLLLEFQFSPVLTLAGHDVSLKELGLEMSVYEEKNELRQLEFIHFEKLSRYLDVDDAWKRLMSEIPTQFRPFRTSEKRFRFTDIR